jgi:hypothetical protein
MSVLQIFIDFAFFNLFGFLKRCRFGFCNFWVEDELQSTIIKSDSNSAGNEFALTLLFPGIAAIVTIFASSVIFLWYYPISKDTFILDSIQLFFIGVISMVSTAFIYFTLGFLNVFAAAYLKSKSFLDFWPDFFSKVKIYLFEQAQPVVKGSMMINTFIFLIPILGLYQLVSTIVNEYD